MRLPDYIIAGVQRCGTTSLHNWLMQHPDVWASGEPLREIHFFDYPHCWGQGLSWYAAQFSNAPPGSLLLGEKSPTYMDHKLVPARVHGMMPGVKLIFVLRDPVDRTWSHWCKAVAKGFEPDPFDVALRLEDKRLSDELAEWGNSLWLERYYLSSHHVRCYKRRGQYVDHLATWLEWFPRQQMLVVKSEEMFKQPARVYAQVCQFLGLGQFVPRLKMYQRLESGDMPRKVQHRLRTHFRSYNRRLASLLGDDKWMWEGRR